MSKIDYHSTIIFINSMKSSFRIFIKLFLLSLPVFLGGCSSNWSVNAPSSTTNYPEPIIVTETKTDTIVTPVITPTITPMVTPAIMIETGLSDATRDIDDNGAEVNSEEYINNLGEIVESFFGFFEKANYESMKSFCTEECVDRYFHEGDVFGMVWAKVIKIGEIQTSLMKNECGILVDVEMETAKTSALYPGTETSFYVVLKKQSDESWLIDSFVTGY